MLWFGLVLGLELGLGLVIYGLALDFPMWSEWNWMSWTRRVATVICICQWHIVVCFSNGIDNIYFVLPSFKSQKWWKYPHLQYFQASAGIFRPRNGIRHSNKYSTLYFTAFSTLQSYFWVWKCQVKPWLDKCHWLWLVCWLILRPVTCMSYSEIFFRCCSYCH